MEEIFSFVDDLGPAKIIHVHNPSLALKAVLFVDNVAMGPSIGGLRMAPDVSTKECFRLARAMTLKNERTRAAMSGTGCECRKRSSPYGDLRAGHFPIEH